MRKLMRLVVGVVVGLLVAAGFAVPSTSAKAAVPYDSTIRFSGYGFGHGWGMSQYGAYGAALKGLTWQQIIGFYYPGTTLASLPSSQHIRIWLTADNDGNLAVRPTTGLRVRASSGHTYVVPATAGTTAWRIVRGATTWQLERQDSSGWKVQATGLPTSNAWWSFENTSSGVVDLVLPSGGVARHRGMVQLVQDGATRRTVNVLPMESYLRGVVPAEMPTSWSAHAVRAQAVAARTYAAKRLRPGSAYDLCDTTTCQVYKGTAAETAGGDAAISATAHQVVRYGGGFADTLFSSSNGGWTVDGGQPYLPAKADPYDGVAQNQAWTASATTAEISNAFGVGTVSRLEVVSRDGRGALGGRLTGVRIVGSVKTVVVTGDRMRAVFGLRSSMFVFTGGLRPGGSGYEFWRARGGVTGWIGLPTGDEHAVPGGSAMPLAGATIYTSGATGTHEVHGAIRTKYLQVNGPTLFGLPTSDEVDGPVAGSKVNTFANNGAIYWSGGTGAHEVHGAILTRYRQVNGPVGLGLPTSDETVGANGARYSNFTKGAIYWGGSTGARVLTGATLAKYRSLGAEKSSLGLPIGEAVASGSTVTTKFQRGSIVCNGSTCSVR